MLPDDEPTLGATDNLHATLADSCATPAHTTAPIPASRAPAHPLPGREKLWPGMGSSTSPASTGTISFVDEDITEGVGGPASPLLMKQRVQALVGAQARDVEVTVRSGKDLDVSLKVTSAAIGRKLEPQIRALPELAPYHVVIQMQVGQ